MDFNSLLNQVVESPSISAAPDIALNLLISLVLGIIVAKTYKRVHKGISYSASYAFSIVMVAMVVTLVMMVIGSNVARAFTLLGAFTLVRFRTAVKDPKDTAFIFLSLVVGLAVGASDYTLAVIGCVMTSLAALLLDKLDFGSLIKLEQVLYLTVNAQTVSQKDLEAILRNTFKKISLINVNYSDSNRLLQYSYNITLKKTDQQAHAIHAISAVEGVKNAEILAAQQVVEF